jgi:hypothetical protein
MSPTMMSNDYEKEMSSFLKAARKQGRPVNCYVSVVKPESAVLDTRFYIANFLIGTLGALAIITGIGTIVIGLIMKLLGKFRS